MRVQYQNGFDTFATSVDEEVICCCCIFDLSPGSGNRVGRCALRQGGFSGEQTAGGWPPGRQDNEICLQKVSGAPASLGKAQALDRRRTGIHPPLSAPPHFTLQRSAHMLGGHVCKFMMGLEIEWKAFFSPGGKYLTELDGF